jgi:hypothetical protein
LQVIVQGPEEDENKENEEDAQSFEHHLSTGRDDEIQSRLSFIVKEKLHEYAKDLRRRTSQVRDEVIVRELTPEATEEISGKPQKIIQALIRNLDSGSRLAENASLMSLIGLQDQSVEVASTPTTCGILPAYIDPFSKFLQS